MKGDGEKIKEYEAELLKVIKTKKIYRFSHAFGYTSFSRATAYNNGLNKLDSIKDALLKNRMNTVVYLLDKWSKSDNPTLQIALMRMICNGEDHRRLNQSYVKNEVEAKMSPELKKELEAAQKKIKV